MQLKKWVIGNTTGGEMATTFNAVVDAIELESGKLATNIEDTNALNISVNGIDADVKGMQADVLANSNKIEQVEANVTTNTGDLMLLKNDVNTLNSSVTNLVTITDSHTTQINNLNTQVSSLSGDKFTAEWQGTSLIITDGDGAKAPVDLVGPHGAKGEKGDQGEKGEQGLPGQDGAKGDKGDQGDSIFANQGLYYQSTTRLDVSGVKLSISNNGELEVGNGSTVDMGGNRVEFVATPTSDQDAANKMYVDDAVSNVSGFVVASDDGMSGFNVSKPTDFTGGGGQGYALKVSGQKFKVTTSSEFDSQIQLSSNFNQTSGNFNFSNNNGNFNINATNGNLDVNTNNVYFNNTILQNVADPVSGQDAATKAYVDANAGGGVDPELVTYEKDKAEVADLAAVLAADTSTSWTFDGNSLKSNTIADGETTTITYTAPAGAKSIEIDFRNDSEVGYDGLKFEVYNSGSIVLTYDSVDLSEVAGTMTYIGDFESVDITYFKDSSAADGGDCGFIDKISYTIAETKEITSIHNYVTTTLDDYATKEYVNSGGVIVTDEVVVDCYDDRKENHDYKAFQIYATHNDLPDLFHFDRKESYTYCYQDSFNNDMANIGTLTPVLTYNYNTKQFDLTVQHAQQYWTPDYSSGDEMELTLREYSISVDAPDTDIKNLQVCLRNTTKREFYAVIAYTIYKNDVASEVACFELIRCDGNGLNHMLRHEIVVPDGNLGGSSVRREKLVDITEDSNTGLTACVFTVFGNNLTTRDNLRQYTFIKDTWAQVDRYKIVHTESETQPNSFWDAIAIRHVKFEKNNTATFVTMKDQIFDDITPELITFNYDDNSVVREPLYDDTVYNSRSMVMSRTHYQVKDTGANAYLYAYSLENDPSGEGIQLLNIFELNSTAATKHHRIKLDLANVNTLLQDSLMPGCIKLDYDSGAQDQNDAGSYIGFVCTRLLVNSYGSKQKEHPMIGDQFAVSLSTTLDPSARLAGFIGNSMMSSSNPIDNGGVFDLTIEAVEINHNKSYLIVPVTHNLGTRRHGTNGTLRGFKRIATDEANYFEPPYLKNTTLPSKRLGELQEWGRPLDDYNCEILILPNQHAVMYMEDAETYIIDEPNIDDGTKWQIYIPEDLNGSEKWITIRNKDCSKIHIVNFTVEHAKAVIITKVRTGEWTFEYLGDD